MGDYKTAYQATIPQRAKLAGKGNSQVLLQKKSSEPVRNKNDI